MLVHVTGTPLAWARSARSDRKIEQGYALLAEAAKIQRDALTAARDTGIPVSELADRLGISRARAYQLLSDAE